MKRKSMVLGFAGVLTALLTVFFLSLPAQAADLDNIDKLAYDELVAGAAKEGKLVGYSALPIFINQHLLKRFHEKYPFI